MRRNEVIQRSYIVNALSMLILLSFIPIVVAKAQKLRCKLFFHDSIYIGGMKPDWFHKVTLKPLTSDFTNVTGASGTFYSDEFGDAQFSLVKNKLNTSDSLMVRATFGWHPVNYIEIKKDRLVFEWDWNFRPNPELVD